MSKNKKILILNTGGTFNKLYNPINGELFVSKDNNAVESILKNSKIKNYEIEGILYKDSLDITQEDRKFLKNKILKSNYKKIIIIHGTDTMDKTAEYLDEYIKNKTIIITGAMIPFSIDTIEATSNFMMAFGSLLSHNKKNIYIAMHGNVSKHTKIAKNKSLGIFQCQK